MTLLEDISNTVQQLFENAQIGIDHKRKSMVDTSATQQHAIDQINAFAEIKAILVQLQLAMDQQKNHEAETLVSDTLITLLNYETLQKNFLFTRDEKFLNVYDTSLDELMKKALSLEQHFAGDQDFTRKVNTIKTLLEKSGGFIKRPELQTLAFSGSTNNFLSDITSRHYV